MLEQVFLCSTSSVDGISLMKIIEFMYGRAFVVSGLEVTKVDNMKVSVSPGKALLVYPLVLIRNTEDVTLDISELEPDCTNDGYHVLGILRTDGQVEFTVIPQIAENMWKTEHDDFIILAVIEVRNGSIQAVHNKHSKHERRDRIKELTSGLVKVDLSDELGYLADKIDNQTLVRQENKLRVNTSAIDLSDLASVDSNLSPGVDHVLQYNGQVWTSKKLATTDEKVKVSESDPTSGYLADKVDGTTIVADDNRIRVEPSAISLSELGDIDDKTPSVNDANVERLKVVSRSSTS